MDKKWFEENVKKEEGFSVGAGVREPESSEILCVGKKYNWINQPERLVYLGYNFSGNGYWHQFAKVESPQKVWCEVLSSDLKMIEESS